MVLNTSFRAKLKRRLLVTLTLCLTAYCLVFLVAQVDARIDRSRAERLRDEMRGLTVGKSTWDDLQGIRARWGRWGEAEGKCTSEQCSYTVSLGAPYARSVFKRLLLYVGHTHFGGASLHVFIENGHVKSASYALHTVVPLGYGPRWEAEMVKKYEMVPYSTSEDGYMLTARASERAELDSVYPPYPGHPHYQLTHPGGCTFCLAIWTEFTPEATPTEKQRMTDFNFSCITRWSPCTDEEDIMPDAGKEYLQQEGKRFDPH